MVTSGVPQGRVLGSVLFLAYINYITTGLRSSIRLFADESKVYRTICDENDEKQLQCDLNKLQKCSENWQLRFHSDKCEVLRVSHARDHTSYPYKFSGCTLQSVTETVGPRNTPSRCHLGNLRAKKDWQCLGGSIKEVLSIFARVLQDYSWS